jgi:tetrahydromethanopterin S-methyltransferase subunit G
MSEAEAGSTNQPDPMETFRELRDAYLDLWSKSMIEAVNTEGYAQASGAMLDSYLTLSAPYRETFEKSIVQSLQQLGLTTSADFSGLAGRLTNIEMRLDDMEAKLDHIEKIIVPSQQFNDLNTKLDRIEKLIMRPQSVQHVERIEPNKPAVQSEPIYQKTAPAAPGAPKQTAAAKPVVQTAPVRQPGGRAPNTAQRATAVRPKQPNAKKGAK